MRESWGRASAAGPCGQCGTVLSGNPRASTDESRLSGGLSGETGDFTDKSGTFESLSVEKAVFTDKLGFLKGLSGERAVFTDKVEAGLLQNTLPGQRK
jgi:hypothetical protein